MDEEYRRIAQIHADQADQIYNNPGGKEAVIEGYLEAIYWYEKISAKRASDFKDIAAIARDMAIVYFNSGNYSRAGKYYIEAINQLLQIDLYDNEYRKLTQLYIDVSDVCIHLANQEGANEALSKAIQAFILIKNKTKAEINIGDPNTNFKQFHTFFEKKSSTQSYMNSSVFRNHKQILCEKHEEINLLDMFENLSIPDKNRHIEHIEEMLSGLSVSNKPNKQFLSTTLFKQPISDTNYRSMAIEFLRLTQAHIQKGLIQDTCSTYKQALDSLNLISQKNDFDQKTILAIHEQREYLNSFLQNIQFTSEDKTIKPIIEQNQQTSSALISTIGMFGYSVPQQIIIEDPSITSEYNKMEF